MCDTTIPEMTKAIRFFGRVQVEASWNRLHLQRFGRFANAAEMNHETVSTLMVSHAQS